MGQNLMDVAAPNGANSHQDIYNFLSNLNTMASSMASSMVQQQQQGTSGGKPKDS